MEWTGRYVLKVASAAVDCNIWLLPNSNAIPSNFKNVLKYIKLEHEYIFA